MSDQVLALVCSDIHLCHSVPIARSEENDWYQAQLRVLNQIKELSEEHGCSVLIAGDLFDKWNSPPELINFAIQHFGMLSGVLAVPGQHDLPMHNYEDRVRSAYWTLVISDAIRNVPPGKYIPIARKRDTAGFVNVWGFPWGTEITPVPEEQESDFNIALVHSYVWTKDKCYPGVSVETSSSQYRNKLKGYDVAVFGDNHIPFTVNFGKTVLYNCGCLIPRRSDERETKPAVGLIYADGTVKRHELDCSEDKWVTKEEVPAEEEKPSAELEAFLAELSSVDQDYIDFCEEVRRYVENPANGVSEGTKKVMLEILGG